MATQIEIRRIDIGKWLSRETEFDSIKYRLLDTPANGLSAWSRTTSGVIAILLFIQIATGLLLAFHYVPVAGNAYTTVAYIELAVRDGAWIRSLHYHSSVMLPVAFGAHILQMLLRRAYTSNRTAWIFGIGMLGLVLAAGATGYALPWDARAINGVNIASSLAGNAPLVGDVLRTWLLNGVAISTLTLSRFYALHVWIVPIMILLAVIARLFIFGNRHDETDLSRLDRWARDQFARNAVIVGVVFIGLSVFSHIYPAPFGPQIAEASTYLPRPGPQFLWLFEMQKFTDGPVAATLAFGFPGLILGGLIMSPFFLKRYGRVLKAAIAAAFVLGFGTAGVLTAAAIIEDRSDTRISEQLAKQELDEAKFRVSTFEPQVQRTEQTHASSPPEPEVANNAAASVIGLSPMPVPDVYTESCAKCHGANGEGTKKFPELIGLTTREEDQLSPELILAIINDPKSVGRSTKMPAYHDKLSEEEKQAIVAWIRSLEPIPDNGGSPIVQTASVDKDK